MSGGAPPLLPSECDYLIVGAGATGMSFADSLLAHNHHHPSSASRSPSVVIVDAHPSPGGQWHDSYSFVRLHQPSAGYGVETERLEPTDGGDDDDENQRHLATREEILRYYRRVADKFEREHGAIFVGGATVDLSRDGKKNMEEEDGGGGSSEYEVRLADGTSASIRVKKRLVDARYLMPDLPVNTPPKFTFDRAKIRCVPVNDLVVASGQSSEGDGSEDTAEMKKRKTSAPKHYVVIGGGKTGMDAVYHLLVREGIDPDDVLWVKPHEMWITARENIGSCLELLRDCTALVKEAGDDDRAPSPSVGGDSSGSSRFPFSRTFLDWEGRGRVYRLDETSVPTKFRDATLDKAELATLRKVERVARNGRVGEIRGEDGALVFEDGSVVNLPWEASGPDDTLYVHCSAGAFNYTKQPPGEGTPPVFSPGRIVVQDVYGTPGFCFAGSVIGRLEALGDGMTDEERNSMALAPQRDPDEKVPALGPSGGDVDVALSSDSGLVQRLTNLRRWREVPELRKWLHGHRLFNLKNMNDEEVGELVEETWAVLKEEGIVE